MRVGVDGERRLFERSEALWVPCEALNGAVAVRAVVQRLRGPKSDVAVDGGINLMRSAEGPGILALRRHNALSRSGSASGAVLLSGSGHRAPPVFADGIGVGSASTSCRSTRIARFPTL